MDIFQQENNCDTSQNDCTTIYFSYPRIVGSGNNALNDTLTQQIERWLTGTDGSGDNTLTPEEFSKSFIADYEKFRQEFPDSRAKWHIRREIELLANNSRFITLQLSEDNYLGGAHGMRIHLFANFIPAGGQRIFLDALIAEGKQDTLERIAESLFRKENNIPAGQSLKEAGYFYMSEEDYNSPFHLTENFDITREGLLFYYNPYDIAPYSIVATILKVPFDSVKDALRPDGILKDVF